MANTPVEKAFDALAIRDTSSHNSDVIDNQGWRIKTIIVENSLNQTVSFQCQASANSDFSNSFNVGSSWDVSATTNTYQTCDSYFPYFRLIATCASAPASGSLTVYICKLGGQ
jgi:hypothetical protein